MKPYGNEGMHHEDNRNSTKTGARPSNNKTTSRRLAKKTRRARDKAALYRAVNAT